VPARANAAAMSLREQMHGYTQPDRRSRASISA
jgi:hypothetical protein